MSKDIDDRITRIRNIKNEDAFLDVTLTLLKIIQNVLGNPDKPKFKKLKRNTKFFANNPGVEELLISCGFELRDGWLHFADTEIAQSLIDMGKRQLISARMKIDSLKAYEVPENSLRYMDVKLGEGKFASVYQGTWENYPVAIKALHPYCSHEAVEDFRREANILRRLKHNNIIVLFAVCLQKISKRHVHVLELMDQTFLDVLRMDPEISIGKLVGKALEVAAGLDHLHNNEILHCDIAARNILLNKQGVVKISDFGLARYANSPDCHLLGKTAVFPIRWTAPEVFTDNVLSKASDVWSYGILCYEFITRGKTPYGPFQNRQIKSKVSNGYRLPQPEECPDDLYRLMLKCWNGEPTRRPTFQNISQDLINMKLNFARLQSQRFAVCFDKESDVISEPPLSSFRRQSMGMRASLRKLVKSVSGKRYATSWGAAVMGEENISIYTSLIKSSSSKIIVQMKKDSRTTEVIKKVILKIGIDESDSYKYALVEVYDPRCGIRRSQPSLNTSLESVTPYARLIGTMEQPIVIKSEWEHKDHTKYVLCPRGAVNRVMELMKMVQEGQDIGELPVQTRGYLLQSAGQVTGRQSMMWNKVWGALDGSSLGVFEDEDYEESWRNSTVINVCHAYVSEYKTDMFTLISTQDTEHIFQAIDKEDAMRWVEAITAAYSAKAPASKKLTQATAVHTGKVLVMTETPGSPDMSSITYGHKQLTLRKEELFFCHNGERLSQSMDDVMEVDIIPANTASGDSELEENTEGFRVVFPNATYRVYPGTLTEHYSWASALHKVVAYLGKTNVLRKSINHAVESTLDVSCISGITTVSETTAEVTVDGAEENVGERRGGEKRNSGGSSRCGSPDSGILSCDSTRGTACETPDISTPDITIDPPTPSEPPVPPRPDRHRSDPPRPDPPRSDPPQSDTPRPAAGGLVCARYSPVTPTIDSPEDPLFGEIESLVPHFNLPSTPHRSPIAHCTSPPLARALPTCSPPLIRTPPSVRVMYQRSCPIVQPLPPPLPPRNTRPVPRSMSTPSPMISRTCLSPSTRPLPALPQSS